MSGLSPLSTHALEALGTFHYLSPSQLSNAGVGKSARTAREKALVPLLKRAKPLVHVQDFGWIPGYGRLESIYQLTKLGAHTLAEFRRCSTEDIEYPKSLLKFQKDYQHRKGLVDIHIAIRAWEADNVERVLLKFDPYYFRPNKRAKTQLHFKPDSKLPPDYPKQIEPDAIVEYTVNGEGYIAVIELHWATDTRRVAKQIDRHITALSQNIVAEKYRHLSPHYVISVHENPKNKKSVQKWFSESHEATNFSEFFDWYEFDTFKASAILRDQR